jgi:hypothetical protein
MWADSRIPTDSGSGTRPFLAALRETEHELPVDDRDAPPPVGLRYNPTMSRTLAINCGSRETL